jgi:hypothetical protein
MPDQLEDLIKKNRDEMDHREPKTDHLARFKEKLNTVEEEPANDSEFNLSYFLKIAAMVVIVFGLAFMLLNNNESGKETASTDAPPQKVALGEVSGEMAAVEQYFEGALQVKLEEVDAFKMNDATFVADFMKNLNELETQYQQLKSDLALNFGDQRIVNAMIQNFRLRVKLMEKLIEQMQITQKEKKQIS